MPVCDEQIHTLLEEIGNEKKDKILIPVIQIKLFSQKISKKYFFLNSSSFD